MENILQKTILLLFISMFSLSVYSQKYTGDLNDSIVGCQSGEVTFGYRKNAVHFNLGAEIGAGLIRNTLAPNLNYDLTFLTYKGYQFGISGLVYYFFSKK